MQVITIGIDLAKSVFHVHGIDANDKVVFNKPLRRSQILPFFAKLAPCLIGMEACASAHYWARELKKLGHDVRLMPAKDVKAYVKRNKNDSVDAAACCEAVRRPTVRTVPVKTPEQQAQLMQHRVRDLLVRQRTQAINALRSHLAELGIVAAQRYDGVKALLTVAPIPVMPACPRMRVPACSRLSHRSPATRLRSPRSTSDFFSSIVKATTANGSKLFPASVFSGRALLSPRFRMLRYSRRDVISPPGSASSHAKILLAASSVWGPLASTATDTCDASWWLAHLPS
jgi:Transposase